MFRNNHKKTITIIFALVVLNLVLWNIFVPIFELPSEPLYLHRIQSIAQTKSLLNMKFLPPGDLVYPDTYPILMTPAVFLFNPPAIFTDETLTKFSSAVLHWVPSQRGTYNRFNHPLSEKQFQWNNLDWSVHTIRFLTSLFAIISFVLLFKLSLNLFGHQSRLPYYILLFAGFAPKLAHRNASIINITLLMLAFSLFFYWTLTKKPSPKTAYCIGLATGLGLITKITGLNLIIFSGAYLLFFVTSWKQRFHQTLFFILGTLTLAGWNLTRNLLLYQDPLALNQAFRIAAGLNPQAITTSLGSNVNYWFSVFETTFVTFWDGFGWETILFSRTLHYSILLTCLLAASGSIISIKSAPAPLKRKLVFLGLSLIIFGLSFLQVNTRFFTPQGKDFFPMIVPIAILFILGWQYWWHQTPFRHAKVSLISLTFILFAVNLWLLFGVVVPKTLGEKNISTAEYYQTLKPNPVKLFLVNLRKTFYR